MHGWKAFGTAVLMTLLCYAQRIQLFNFVKISAQHSIVNYTAVTCTAVSTTPLWHVYDTAVPLDLIFEMLWLIFKGISIKKGTYAICPPLYLLLYFHPKIWGLAKDCFRTLWCHCHRCSKNRRFRSQISLLVRSHIQKGFNQCIKGLGGVVWWKKPEVENLVSESH
jgi:hypothetical protein